MFDGLNRINDNVIVKTSSAKIQSILFKGPGFLTFFHCAFRIHIFSNIFIFAFSCFYVVYFNMCFSVRHFILFTTEFVEE